MVGGIEEPPRLVRAKGWDWDHEVRVWLPPSYMSSDRTYPTLWVTDNTLELIQGALVGAEFGMAPELVVVAVGPPKGTAPMEFQRRRSFDFILDKSLMGPLFAAMPDGTIGVGGVRRVAAAARPLQRHPERSPRRSTGTKSKDSAAS